MNITRMVVITFVACLLVSGTCVYWNYLLIVHTGAVSLSASDGGYLFRSVGFAAFAGFAAPFCIFPLGAMYIGYTVLKGTENSSGLSGFYGGIALLIFAALPIIAIIAYFASRYIQQSIQH